MCPLPPCDAKRLSQTNPSTRPVIDQLVRALASMAPGKESLTATGMDGDVEEVLVDVEVDGSRYMLLRLPKPAAASTRVSLSPREREIVRMVAQGHPNKVIAGVLNISGWTVCTHMRRIFAKLNVGSRAAMVARLLEMGNVDERIRAGQDGRIGLGEELTAEGSNVTPAKAQSRGARR
jgi:DNA-binding CsgD family transcriptional regulator